MPIEFNCPSCQRRYQVKDELAGKGAKCGKCGHRMRVPEATAAGIASTPKRTAATPQVRTKPELTNDAAGSWLDDEFEVESPIERPAAPRGNSNCPACGASLASGAVLCVACGFDARTGAKHATRREVDLAGAPASEKKKGRSKIGTAASLLRGTLFSFLGAMLGAVIWAAIAYWTSLELGYIAWGLGGLAGFGMALGHDDDDGTLAGIIAAFMSLGGIVIAKILIIVFIVAAFAINIASGPDDVEFKRNLLVNSLTEKKLRAQGVDTDKPGDELWEKANADAKAEATAEVAQLSEQELDAHLEALIDEPDDEADNALAQNAAGGGGDAAAQPADGENIQPGRNDSADSPDEVALAGGPGGVGLFFKLMFSPMDGIFMLLAFFTAYKVGSGQMTD
jgi:predicted Zn finger-like uncharacterized protein